MTVTASSTLPWSEPASIGKPDSEDGNHGCPPCDSASKPGTEEETQGVGEEAAIIVHNHDDTPAPWNFFKQVFTLRC